MTEIDDGFQICQITGFFQRSTGAKSIDGNGMTSALLNLFTANDQLDITES